MIYEQFDLKRNMVRFIHLQYKTWDEKKTIYFSSGNIKDQINKMASNLCDGDYCSNHGSDPSYRFPNCSAFLRPTSKINRPDSNLISSGQHIPICVVKKIEAIENQINSKNINGKSLSSRIFEELFIENFIGSKWIPITELESFYKSKKITSEIYKIRVHAQEFEYLTEEEMDENPPF